MTAHDCNYSLTMSGWFTVQITKHVNLPEPLIEAQKNGTLVVFAGAGVSMGSPSNLPSFEQLAIQVAAGALEPAENEPLDRFLGRLEKQGVQVHTRARDILSNPASEHTPLHHAILSLFNSPNNIRLVTTNFDRHFTSVALDLFQDSVEIYYAPALPLGRKFNGLVYLHGSVEKEPERMILTDSDFGRAYLTDGWATRFLHEMFANYTVLFIGYSHNDPVMQYLARGLPPKTPNRRYVLTPAGRDDHWEFLGIEVITYPLNDSPDEHRALSEAVAAWVNLAKMGALDHERRIKEIVTSPPPLEPEAVDYIENALKELSTVRFFTQYARSLEWLRWAENKQVFRPLFQPSEDVDEISQEIGTWFVRHFVCEYPEEALALVQRQGQILSPFLWRVIAHQLAYRNPRPDPQTLAQWVTVLLNSPQPQSQANLLDYLLKACRCPEDNVTALLLFEYLTRPRIKLKPYLSFLNAEDKKEKQVDVDIIVRGDKYWLERTWANLFRPHLAQFADGLEFIVTMHLMEAYHLLHGFGRIHEYWGDPISRGRAAIEEHGQNIHKEAFDVVINAARNVIEWMLNHEPQRAAAVIERWSSSDAPLLRRLAVHGVTENPNLSADKKISWILDRDWLYVYDLRHELFRLLKQAYSNATMSTRTRLLDQVNRGPHGKEAEDFDKKILEYEVYNLLFWLHQADPDCDLARIHFAAKQSEQPGFNPSPFPGFHRWISVGPIALGPIGGAVAVEELLGKNPQDEIDNLLADEKKLVMSVRAAATQDFDWSWQLAKALEEKEAWTSTLWDGILRGWQNRSLTEDQWKKVLSLLTEHPQLYEFSYSVATLLEEGIKKSPGELPSTCLPLAEQVAHQFVRALIQKPEAEEPQAEDWLAMAINHPGGKITLFLLHTLSKKRQEVGDSWIRLPEQYKNLFEKMIAAESYAARLGCVVLASQLHFLFALDNDWTRENILPLLDWSIDERRARQAWHGYLSWGRSNEALLPHVLPLFETTFSKLSGALSSRRDRFCGYLASIAIFSSINPVKDGWLGRFLKAVEPEDRKRWASHVSHQLRSLPSDSAQHLWDRWMGEYWSQRITGVPVPLSEGEMESMVEWAVRLEPIFPAVVDKICASPAPALEHTFLYHELVEKEFAITHPTSVTRLLRHLLPNACEPFYHCEDVEKLVRSLVGSTAPHSELLLVCDDLARLGCSNAAKLRELVEKQSNS